MAVISCQQQPSSQSPVAKAPTASNIKESAPEKREAVVAVATVRHGCAYYEEVSGKMALKGSLPKGKRVSVLKRYPDGWAKIQWSNQQEGFVLAEDLTTGKTFRADASRAAAAAREAFPDPRPKRLPGREEIRRERPSPPPADFIPPPLPDAAGAASDLEEAAVLFPETSDEDGSLRSVEE